MNKSRCTGGTHLIVRPDKPLIISYHRLIFPLSRAYGDVTIWQLRSKGVLKRFAKYGFIDNLLVVCPLVLVNSLRP